MDGRRLFKVIALLALIVSAAVTAETHHLVVNGEELEFVAAPERGYVVKLGERMGNITALSGVLAIDAKNAMPVCGSDRHGVWVIENEGPRSRNKAKIQSLSTGGQVAYTAPLFSSNGETVAIIPEIVVRVKPGIEMEEVQTVCEAVGCTIRKPMEFTTQEYLIEVRGLDAEAVFAAVETLSRSPEVEWACPNTAFRPKLAGQMNPGHRAAPLSPIVSSTGDPNTLGIFPNDEYFPMQWHLHNTGQSGGMPDADINAPEAWEITTGDPNIVIAVVDTGIDDAHPDLANNLVQGYDFFDDDDLPVPEPDDPDAGHGTVCAGHIAAAGNNTLGVTGVANTSKIMPIRINANSWVTPQSQIATAFRWAAAHGADVLSNSWGDFTALPIIHSALADVTKPDGLGREGKGCVVLFAAGNESGPVTFTWPALYPEVIAVGATDHNDTLSWYSNYGQEMDIVAPGGGGIETEDLDLYLASSTDLLWTTDIAGAAGYDELNLAPDISDYTDRMYGTSAATPIAAGVAALILSLEPDLTQTEVRHFLERFAKDLGEPGRDEYYGWGRVDARAALDMVLAKRADLNDDWRVDLDDLVMLIESWATDDTLADIAPATRRDGFVDDQDLELLMQYWQVEIPEMDAVAE
jgi:subtilisin family serine protease